MFILFYLLSLFYPAFMVAEFVLLIDLWHITEESFEMSPLVGLDKTVRVLVWVTAMCVSQQLVA